jgi:hypothetical protein
VSDSGRAPRRTRSKANSGDPASGRRDNVDNPDESRSKVQFGSFGSDAGRLGAILNLPFGSGCQGAVVRSDCSSLIIGPGRPRVLPIRMVPRAHAASGGRHRHGPARRAEENGPRGLIIRRGNGPIPTTPPSSAAAPILRGTGRRRRGDDGCPRARSISGNSDRRCGRPVATRPEAQADLSRPRRSASPTCAGP